MKVKVRSIPAIFRRAGMVFTKNGSTHDVDDKTLKILKEEPMLVVEVLPEKDEEKPAPAAKKK